MRGNGRPIPATTVASQVDRWLRNHPRSRDYDLSSFCCAGSYPATVQAYLNRFPRCSNLVYNDIDIYVQANQVIAQEADSKIVHVWDESNVIPGSPIKVNVIVFKDLNLASLLDGFDINCILVGFCVCSGRISRWDIRNEFWNFLRTETLDLVGFEQLERPAGAFIRLLYKSHQLGFPYQLPPDPVLRRTLHYHAFGVGNAEKVRRMPNALKLEIVNRFYVKSMWSSTYNSQLFMLVDKNRSQRDSFDMKSLVVSIYEMRLPATALQAARVPVA